ncbi:MAG: hypothetical protein M0R21_02385 [Lentimicrobiaceae bacterium]|nr:hypothetical protein [Lentimicrobiaceae bacterium]
MDKRKETRNRIFGFGGTLIFHGLLFLLMIWVAFTTPIPPFPEDGGGGTGLGIEVNLGNSEEGMGDEQPQEIAMPKFKETKITAVSEQTTVSKNAVAPDENVLSEENGEETSLKTSPDRTKEKIAQPQPTVNPNALFKKKAKTGNEGITGNPGDQGNPNGTPNSKNYYGSGGQGSGGGQGGGQGTGVGTGTGGGVSFALSGRKSNYIPVPQSRSKEQGKVVVEITVNRQGEVTRAKSGARGTTTTDLTLWKLAEQSAIKAHFDAKPGAPEEQKGTITYIFITRN